MKIKLFKKVFLTITRETIMFLRILSMKIMLAKNKIENNKIKSIILLKKLLSILNHFNRSAKALRIS